MQFETLSIVAIHKGCPHIRGGEGVRQKWANADRGRGWLVKCGRPLGKIIATIFDDQPNVDRPGQREGGPKNSQICADILYG